MVRGFFGGGERMTVWTGMDGGVAWTCFHGEITQADWDAYIGQLQGYVDDKLPHLSMLLVARSATVPTATMRVQMRDFLKNNWEIAQRVDAGAMVFNSILARAALNAINWLKGKPYPEAVFEHTRDALAWLGNQNADLDIKALRAAMETAIPDNVPIF
jgi:hypothetical protein